MRTLPPPDDSTTHPDSVEIIRGWVVAGDFQVSLAFDVFGKDAALWGQLLAEIATHIAVAMSGEGYGRREEIFSTIRRELLAHLDSPDPGLNGVINGPEP